MPVLTNATSYTWEVPADWLVNGISGPVVIGQGNSVSITAPSCNNPVPIIGEGSTVSSICSPRNVVIKVKGVSSLCGNASNYRSKTVTYDYPVSISHYQSSTGTVTFSASPTGFPSYQWWVSDGWTIVSNYNYSIEVSHNNIPGYASLLAQTYCNNYYSSSDYFKPVDCSKLTSAYPNPATNELLLAPSPCDIEISSVAVEENGTFHSLKANKKDGGYQIDIAALKPGLHVLKTKNSKGEEHFIRFLKSK